MLWGRRKGEVSSPVREGKYINVEKSIHEPSGHQVGAYLRFLWHEATRSVLRPHGWNASPAQGYTTLTLRPIHLPH